MNLGMLFLVLQINLAAQPDPKTPNPFDFGKMWTFENPPKKWLKDAYNFAPEDAWFDYVRQSSLRFASWCSASFISADGLIMTNHHCSRDVVGKLQKEGENFDKTGFYAEKLKDERKAEGLFVEQLIKVADISAEIEKKTATAGSDEELTELRKKALDEIKANYEAKADWKGLRIQTVSYYSGGKYSLYGYKRYDDIRLVWIPELDLGFFGGDPDNFTYPRYNLDATFWRAYDENGKPVNSSAHFLKFNSKGAAAGEEVFVVGNPGRTERYRTVAQLKFDRDNRYNYNYRFMKNRNDMLMSEYEEMAKDPSKEMEAQALLNQIASLANGMKAYGGIVKGLNDPELFGRKVAMENYIRSKAGKDDELWQRMEALYEPLYPNGWAVTHLSPNPLRSNIFMGMHGLAAYQKAVNSGKSEAELEKLKARITGIPAAMKDPREIKLFTFWLQEIHEDVYPGDMTVKNAFNGMSIENILKTLSTNSLFSSEAGLEKYLNNPGTGEKDPYLTAAMTLIEKFQSASEAFSASSKERQMLEAKIANQAFKVFGTSLPPDATFTLRISDGIMKGYDYNGTTAPVSTTFYGLYDRFYSHNQKFPWSLPKRWQNPPMELLKAPFNCVSTNDIIGGNSGSPLINKNREVVGLIFDGNIESLPGNFIFDEKGNRTVSVHSAGIYAALKYIYKADRIIKELDTPRK